MPRTYLDHAASSPLVPQALEALQRHAGLVGNPSGLHGSARQARAVLEDAREDLADAVGAHPTEVVFTGSGSEADSIALWAGLNRPGRGRVLVGATEHPAVSGALADPRVTALGCDAEGVVDLSGLADLEPTVGLVSLMTVNNETGTIQPVARAAATLEGSATWLHTDAVQALGHLPLDFATSGADLLSLSAHKVGGPVGIGALLVRREVTASPWGWGGGQERGLRSGTQPVVLAAGFAAAARAAVDRLADEAERLSALRTRLVQAVAGIDGARLNGGAHTSPAILNVTFEHTRADDVLMLLDEAGIDCSTGSACRAGVHQPSEVLLAMGRSQEQAAASVRFSFGPTTTAAEVEQLATVLPRAVTRARAARAMAGAA